MDTNNKNSSVPTPPNADLEPKSFRLYTGKAPLVLQIFAGLMWLSGLGSILQGIPLLLIFGIGIIPIVLGVLVIKYARGIFKMEAKGYKGVFILNAIAVLFWVAAKLVGGWPISVDSSFIIQIFAVGLTLLIFYLYKPKFEEAVKTFFWDKIILIVLAALIVVFGGLYFFQKPTTATDSQQSSLSQTTENTAPDYTDTASQQQGSQNYTTPAPTTTTPTPQQWSTYTNSHFNYSVTYPSNWNYKEGVYNPAANNQFVDFGINSAGSQTITLNNDPNPYHHNTLDEYSQNYNTNDATEQSRSKITINGKPAVQIISKDGLITTLIMRDTDHQVFSWLYWNTSPEDKQIYDTMLQKFKY